MDRFDCIVSGGTVVTGGEATVCDIGIADGRIAALGRNLTGAAQRIDAGGRIVLPGGIDSHCHIEQPNPGPTVNADSWATGSASALAGGTTSVICFAAQQKGGSLMEATRSYHEFARQSRVDYAFHLMITDPTTEVIEHELPALVEAGNRSIKIFLTYDAARLTDGEALRVLAAARRLGAMVCVHAEHHDLVAFYQEALVAAGLNAPKYHAWSRPMLVERECVHRVAAMAEALDVPVQVFHVSGADSAAEIARARARGLTFWGETCPQYLVLGAADLDRPGFEGAKFICSPAPRTSADQEALWTALRTGVLSNVSSDHSPNRFDDPRGKKVAGEDAPFTVVPNGVPGLAARLPILFSEGVVKGRIDLPTFAALSAGNAAHIFGLAPRKGAIAVGADADLVLWDPQRRVRLTNALMQHGVDYTPFEGLEVTGWPVTTLLRGRIACEDGKVRAETGTGQFLARAPYAAIRPRGVFPVPFNPVDRVLTDEAAKTSGTTSENARS